MKAGRLMTGNRLHAVEYVPDRSTFFLAIRRDDDLRPKTLCGHWRLGVLSEDDYDPLDPYACKSCARALAARTKRGTPS